MKEEKHALQLRMTQAVVIIMYAQMTLALEQEGRQEQDASLQIMIQILAQIIMNAQKMMYAVLEYAEEQIKQMEHLAEQMMVYGAMETSNASQELVLILTCPALQIHIHAQKLV